jgi:hypothetical protein
MANGKKKNGSGSKSKKKLQDELSVIQQRANKILDRRSKGKEGGKNTKARQS